MLADFEHQIVTPKNRYCYPQKIRYVHGDVCNAEGLLAKDGSSAVLRYAADGDAPILVLDMGPATPGGYPVFKVSSASENAVIRISYSDDYRFMGDKTGGANGDFIRGCCKYLGVELPVLPANPGRFELYTVESGEYMSPLIQGQQRFVRISLENPGSFAELEYFYIYYTSDMSPIEGGFQCDNAKLSSLWYWSVYTYQIASITSDAWDTLNGWLFPRALTKGNDAGIVRSLMNQRDYTFSFTARISQNPYFVSGIGFTFRAPDQDNGYVARLDLDGGLYIYRRINKVYHELKHVYLDIPLVDNRDYRIEVKASGDHFTILIDGQECADFTDDMFGTGSVGFCQMQEKWAMVTALEVRGESGDIVFSDDFRSGLDAYIYTKTPPFISDGAKRDRLPWSGDLDWAGRNGYYSMRNHAYMKGALELFAFHQNDEGFVLGTCYPENTIKPVRGDYGYYESDIFSAWFVIAAADYLLYTGDKEASQLFYQAAKADLEYLLRFVQADGIFNQRYETSKGLWDHVLGDYGINGYNNIVIYDALCEGAFMAEHLGYENDAVRFLEAAKRMKRAIQAKLTDETGAIVKCEKDRSFCYMSNSYALAIGFFDRQTAKEVSAQISEQMPSHGKVISTNIRGAYQYGLEQDGFERLTKKHIFHINESTVCSISWLDMLDDDDLPHTTYECMHYPPFFDINGQNWGDKSHPDTAMAHILSGCILGVVPLTPGFGTFEVRPHMYGLRQASGIIPVPGGSIELQICSEEERFALEIQIDSDRCEGTLYLPVRGSEKVYVNGAQIECPIEGERAVLSLSRYGSGSYVSK